MQAVLLKVLEAIISNPAVGPALSQLLVSLITAAINTFLAHPNAPTVTAAAVKAWKEPTPETGIG